MPPLRPTSETHPDAHSPRAAERFRQVRRRRTRAATAALDVELLSTGGTAKMLADSGVAVTEISDYTGFPEMMDGRVKTLHPGYTAAFSVVAASTTRSCRTHAIEPIDLVVINLYPFQQTVAKPDCTFDDAVENIDIGGPAMVRAAAKNHASVTVVVDPADYPALIAEIAATAATSATPPAFRWRSRPFEHTAQYDGAIANYFGTTGHRPRRIARSRAR